MPYETLQVKMFESHLQVKIHRPSSNNSINLAMLNELRHAISTAEDNANCRVIIIEGHENFFCTGLDFHELISWEFSEEKIADWAEQYMSTLRLISSTCNLIVAKVDGKALAGGIGLIAASDYVLASNRTTFKLTETLWGLLPAMVAPYLIRRIGFQKAYAMTFTAKTLPAQEAHEIHLVDEISDNLEESVQQLIKRFERLESATITGMKGYFRKMWIIDPLVEKAAIKEITTLLKKTEVQHNIRNFVSQGIFPWAVERN